LKDRYENDAEFREKKKAYNREYARRKKAEREAALIKESTAE
jgi:hypothetical protein